MQRVIFNARLQNAKTFGAKYNSKQSSDIPEMCLQHQQLLHSMTAHTMEQNVVLQDEASFVFILPKEKYGTLSFQSCLSPP